MCGFALRLRLSTDSTQQTPFPRSALQRILSTRGPDEQRFIEHKALEGIFCRLVIRGGEQGQQPLFLKSNALLFFNGEIYNSASLAATLGTSNHDSDTQLLGSIFEQQRWDLMAQLKGMYAIAIYSPNTHSLHLWRDAFGQKPLYYSFQNDQLFVSSDLKSQCILRDGLKFDREAFEAEPWTKNQLDTRSNAPVPSFWKDVQLVQRGTHTQICLRSGLIKTEHLVRRVSNLSLPEQQMRGLSEALSHLGDSCGLALSGGLDSHIIASSLVKSKQRVRYYSWSNTATELNGETQRALTFSKEQKIPLQFASAASDKAQHWLRALFVGETPLLTPDHWYKLQLWQQLKNENPDVKVVLTGQGADELYGGYLSMLGADIHECCEALSYLLQNEEADNRYLLAQYQAVKARELEMHGLHLDDRICAYLGLETRSPLLDEDVQQTLKEGLQNTSIAIEDFYDKAILRRWAQSQFALATQFPKTAFFYGAGLNDVRSELEHATREAFAFLNLNVPDLAQELPWLVRQRQLQVTLLEEIFRNPSLFQQMLDFCYPHQGEENIHALHKIA